jgi:hypothetical protein
MNNAIAWLVLTILINIMFNLNILLSTNRLITDLIEVNKETSLQVTELNTLFQSAETYVEIIE